MRSSISEKRFSVAESYDMSPSELRELSQVVKDNAELIERRWNEFFPE
jgi:hypothetical protein